MRVYVLLILCKVLTDHRIETHAKTPVQKVFGGGSAKNPPFATYDTAGRRAPTGARCSSAPSRHNSQGKRCSIARAAWRGVDKPGRLSRRQAQPASGTRQRRQLQGKRAEPLCKAGEATAIYCETKGGRAYLVQHQYPNPISSAFTWAALSFVRPGILEELGRAPRTGARSRRARVPW